jgi:hypothetical protein
VTHLLGVDDFVALRAQVDRPVVSTNRGLDDVYHSEGSFILGRNNGTVWICKANAFSAAGAVRISDGRVVVNASAPSRREARAWN